MGQRLGFFDFWGFRNTEIEEKNDCELEEETDPAIRIYEFTVIPSFVAVITFSLNEQVYTYLKLQGKVELRR